MVEQAMPMIDRELCVLCGDCVAACPTGAASIAPTGQVVLDEQRCAYCGECEDLCPVGAIMLPYDVVLLPPEADTGD